MAAYMEAWLWEDDEGSFSKLTSLGLGAGAGSENLDLKAFDLGDSHSCGCV